MRRTELLICHEDAAYAARLSGYLQAGAFDGINVQVFTAPDPLQDYLKKMEDARHTEDVFVLISPALLVEIMQLPAYCTPVLLSPEREDGPDDLPVICQFQRAPDLQQAILEIVQKGRGGNGLQGDAALQAENKVMREAEVIGVYSPVGRSGKTILALSLGQIIAEQKKTLYVNLEDYHGFAQLVHRGGGMDLADLIYRMRQSSGSMAASLGGVVRSFGSLDYIQPPASACDIRDVGIGEWKELVKRLALEGEYETIILDMGTQIEEVNQLLSLCSVIYVPVLSDPWSGAKLAQMRDELEMTGWGFLKERMQPVSVPAPGPVSQGGYPENLLQTKAGAYARGLWNTRKNEGRRSRAF